MPSPEILRLIQLHKSILTELENFLSHKVEVFYTKEALAILKKQFDISPAIIRKIMNPLCGPCIYERGREALKKINAKD